MAITKVTEDHMMNGSSSIQGSDFACKAVAAMVLGCAPANAQTRADGVRVPPATIVVPAGVEGSSQNRLVFPFGVQTFEEQERIELGSDIGAIAGWSTEGAPGLVRAIVSDELEGVGRAGGDSKRWLAIDDLGGGAGHGFATAPVLAPSPWDYQWSLAFRVDIAPRSPLDVPTLAVQHARADSFVDTWAIRLTPTGAELVTTAAWGSEQALPLFSWSGTPGLSEWIDVRVEASLQRGTLRAFVGDAPVGVLRSRPPAETDLTRMRFAYHGGGAGNSTALVLDDLGVAFLAPVCNESLLLTFSTEDDEEIALFDGQAISSPAEFGAKLTITGSGANAGAAIFDSTPGGPNDPSADPDLIVGLGNVLILQDDKAPAAVGDFFPAPNDDDQGGTLAFAFLRPLQPLRIDLIDVDAEVETAKLRRRAVGAPIGGVIIRLLDFFGNSRVFTVPANWTGDRRFGGPGVGTLDLTTTLPQPGFGSVASAVDVRAVGVDVEFDPAAVVQMSIEMGGSGAVDNFEALIPCVVADFEREDDRTPIPHSGTVLHNGQDLSTPPEFGTLFELHSSGGAGAAIFDSTPGGPNDLFSMPDRDLLVGLGNVLIIQNAAAATQTAPGFFDVPNDTGGTLVFEFEGTVECNRIDVIDCDTESVTLTLEDLVGNQRVFTVPAGWTGDLLDDGPPGFGTLDLSTLAPQAGATATQGAGFDADEVVRLTIQLSGEVAVDNLCFCP